jgi:hypothetical protein
LAKGKGNSWLSWILLNSYYAFQGIEKMARNSFNLLISWSVAVYSE